MYKSEEIKFRCLHPDEIEIRTEGPCTRVVRDGKVYYSTKVVLFKTAIGCQAILDELVGPMNWQRTHTTMDGKTFCTVSIWDDTKRDWVSKQDVGTEQNFEKEKAAASDSFKRACTLWGIGRELYYIRDVRVEIPEEMMSEEARRNPASCTENPLARGNVLYVAEIYCDEENIPTALRIVNQANTTLWTSRGFEEKKKEALGREKARKEALSKQKASTTQAEL